MNAGVPRVFPLSTDLRLAEGFSVAVRRLFMPVLVVLCLGVLAGPAPEALGAVSDGLLPEACPEGWPREGEIRHFTKDTLYEHINGEAELFFPFGFEGLATAAYMKRPGSPVAVIADVYRMGSVLNAFGVYSSYRNPDDAAAPVGAGGTLNPAQLLFYQDRYFVRISASGTSELDEKTLLACAKALAGRLPGPPAAPQELGLFPAGGVVAGTERYTATSLLGYPFFRAGLSADVRIDGHTAKAFVVIEESPEGAQKAIERYDSYLRQSGRDSGLSPLKGSSALTAADPLYSQVVILRQGPHIFGLARLTETAAALKFLADWAGQLRTP